MEVGADYLKLPRVLMSTLSEITEKIIKKYIKDTQTRLFQALKPANVTNLPNSLETKVHCG